MCVKLMLSAISCCYKYCPCQSCL